MTLRRDLVRPALALLLLGLTVPAYAVLGTQSPVFRALPACGVQGELMLTAGELPSCVHADDPPPGVDVTDAVTTAELKQREGAGPTAFDAAQDLGVPSVNVATSQASPTSGRCATTLQGSPPTTGAKGPSSAGRRCSSTRHTPPACSETKAEALPKPSRAGRT